MMAILCFARLFQRHGLKAAEILYALRLQEILVHYKKDFVDFEWANEKYKWVAVQNFQENWDVNAEDFADMLTRSLSKTVNLLASMNNFPARMITKFAWTSPEEVRAMFLRLFDETGDVYERIKAFKADAAVMLSKYGKGLANHYQNENAITTYLWLRFPDKYYLYKFGDVKAAALELKSSYLFKKGFYADNIRNFYRFYDELNEELKKDEELVALLKSKLDSACYPDSELKTLTEDICFYISHYLKPNPPDGMILTKAILNLFQMTGFRHWMNIYLALQKKSGWIFLKIKTL